MNVYLSVVLIQILTEALASLQWENDPDFLSVLFVEPAYIFLASSCLSLRWATQPNKIGRVRTRIANICSVGKKCPCASLELHLQPSSRRRTTALFLTPSSSPPKRPKADRTSPFSKRMSCCCSFHHARCRSQRRF